MKKIKRNWISGSESVQIVFTKICGRFTASSIYETTSRQKGFATAFINHSCDTFEKSNIVFPYFSAEKDNRQHER